VLTGGLICLIDDAGPVILWSTDNGLSWAQSPGAGILHGLPDRALELGGQTLFTTGHQHRGSQPRAKIRQAPSEQMAYISRNLGRSWEAFSVIANEKCLVLCEASVIRLPERASLAAANGADFPALVPTLPRPTPRPFRRPLPRQPRPGSWR